MDVDTLKPGEGRGKWKLSPDRVRGSCRDVAILEFLERLLISFFGPSFLVIPIVMMRIFDNPSSAVLCITIFLFGFGFILAKLQWEAKYVLAATTAYAAVLVVFVGSDS